MSKCIYCGNDTSSFSKKNNLYSCKHKTCKKDYSTEQYNFWLKIEKEKTFRINSLKKLNEEYKSESINRVFSVGENVEHICAFFDDVKILEEIDGKFYKIQYTTSNERHGVKITQSNVDYVSWLDLIKLCTNDKEFNQRSEYSNKKIEYFQTHLNDLLSKFYVFGTIMNPDYQRDFVWEVKDKQLLIDSIFNLRDIGKFVFIRLEYKEHSPSFEILDGKQRLNAIIDFYEDKFEYNGLRFSQLSKNDRRFFLSSMINMGISAPLSEQDKYKYFLNLNTAGKPQSEDHLNKVRKMIK